MSAVADAVDSAEPAAAPVAAFQRISTRSVPIDARFDLWRSQFVAPRIELPRGFDRRRGFDGELISSAGHGIQFSEIRVDPTACQFGLHETDLVLFGCIRGDGVLNVHCGRDQTASLRACDGIALLDCHRPLAVVHSRYLVDYLTMPRALVAEALGAAPVPIREPVRMMRSGELTRALQRQLAVIGTRGESMSAVAADRALHEARALAVTLLAGLHAHWRALPDALDSDVSLAGRCLLRQHLDDPAFTGDHLAVILGCSRAHLYRLFERGGDTVSGQLRELRLKNACALLEAQPDRTVATIALACGYTEPCAFDKAFRRRFGMTPRDWRLLARETAGMLPDIPRAVLAK